MSPSLGSLAVNFARRVTPAVHGRTTVVCEAVGWGTMRARSCGRIENGE
jgi:hypothetical protein